MLTDGLDPSEQKQIEKQAQKITTENTFHTLALEWHAYKSKSWSEGYAESVLEALGKDIFPHVCKRPVAEIKPLEMLAVLRMIEKRGALEKMRKVRQYCNQIWQTSLYSLSSEIIALLTSSASLEKTFFVR